MKRAAETCLMKLAVVLFHPLPLLLPLLLLLQKSWLHSWCGERSQIVQRRHLLCTDCGDIEALLPHALVPRGILEGKQTSLPFISISSVILPAPLVLINFRLSLTNRTLGFWPQKTQAVAADIFIDSSHSRLVLNPHTYLIHTWQIVGSSPKQRVVFTDICTNMNKDNDKTTTIRYIMRQISGTVKGTFSHFAVLLDIVDHCSHFLQFLPK